MFNLDDYETVEERLVKFWKDNPNGRIHTKLLDHTSGRFIVEAHVFRSNEDDKAWATGLAEETIQGRGVNSTSALENCETSAIGRALANAGYATKGKRASREEMIKVKAKADVSAVIADTKAKMAQTSGEYVPVPKEDDPWTIRTAEPVQTMEGATKLLKEVLGAKTQEDIPSCKHGQMVWKTGKKNNKPWGCFSCNEMPRLNPCDPVWYVIDKETGTWKPQVKW